MMPRISSSSSSFVSNRLRRRTRLGEIMPVELLMRCSSVAMPRPSAASSGVRPALRRAPGCKAACFPARQPLVANRLQHGFVIEGVGVLAFVIDDNRPQHAVAGEHRRANPGGEKGLLRLDVAGIQLGAARGEERIAAVENRLDVRLPARGGLPIPAKPAGEPSRTTSAGQAAPWAGS